MKRVASRVIAVAGLCLAVVAAAAQPSPQPVTLSWNSPGPQYTNLVYNLYWTTNVATPTNQWAKLATNISGTSFHTNLTPNAYFFSATAVDTFWKLESPFSAAAATPQPLTTPLLNLTVLPQ